MMDQQTNNRGPGRLASPARNNYFYGKLMDVWHFEMEQTYHNRKRWLLNRLSLGYGVLCGLEVAATVDGSRIRVGPGVAVDQYGREIIVPNESPPIDPRQPTDNCGRPDGDPVTGPAIVTLNIRYLECASDPAPALVDDCDPLMGCQPSTIRERYMLQIRADEAQDAEQLSAEQCTLIFPEDPPEDLNRRGLLCETLSGACPKPDGDCVVLATIEITEDGAIGAIDTCTARPVLYSNAMLLDLILCLADRVDACCAADTVLRYVSGDNQITTAGSTLRQPLVAEVLRGNAPVIDEVVEFSVTTGDGLIGDDPTALQPTFQVTTDANGQATLPIWQLGQVAGPSEVQATLLDSQAAGVRYRATGVPDERALPVVRNIWPENGQNLLAAESEEDRARLERWLQRPWIEVTFDQEMDQADLTDPRPWLRAWRIRPRDDDSFELRPIELAGGELIDDPVLGTNQPTYRYEFDQLDGEFRRARYLIQMFAENDNIVNDDASPLLLDAEFRGTHLDNDFLRRIWENDSIDFIPRTQWDRISNSGEILPQSGDGDEGGRFNSWFQTLGDID